jgi:cytochrome c oxidase subunit II
MLKNTFLASMAFLLSGCEHFDVPMSTIHTVTDWGRNINHVYLIATVITAFVGIVVAGLMVYVLWRFRERPGDTTIPEQVHGSFTLELIWTVVPCILLIFLLVPTWEAIFSVDHTKQDTSAYEVKVIGYQWWWEFQYPDSDIVTAGEVHLPENTKVNFTITSNDVIHSFWIPKFGGKVDALPGVLTHMVLTTPPASGQAGGDYYQGQCVELCGLSHALMRFSAVVHTADEWERWKASHNTPPKVETRVEKRGEELFAEKGCMACHAIYGTDYAGVLGPNLTNFGNRRYLAAEVFKNDQPSLHKWLKNPQAVKPGALMVELGLTDEEIQFISAYIRNSTIKTY